MRNSWQILAQLFWRDFVRGHYYHLDVWFYLCHHVRQPDACHFWHADISQYKRIPAGVCLEYLKCILWVCKGIDFVAPCFQIATHDHEDVKLIVNHHYHAML